MAAPAEGVVGSMIWVSDVLPVVVIAFVLTMRVRWSLAALLLVGLGFGVVHWIAIGVVTGYHERGGDHVAAFPLVVGFHTLAWTLGAVSAAQLKRRAPSGLPLATAGEERPARPTA